MHDGKLYTQTIALVAYKHSTAAVTLLVEENMIQLNINNNIWLAREPHLTTSL